MFTYDTTTPVMVDGWDPATEYSDGILAMSNMYETLTRYDSATHSVKPLLATSWSSADQGKTWTFHLRPGVHFHTGRLMTAQAAKAAILRTMKLGGGRRLRLGRGAQHQHPGQLHHGLPPEVRLAARSRGVRLLLRLHLRHPGGRAGSLTKWLNTPHDAGTGPYTVQSWNKGQEFEVVLKAFPGYWGGWSGPHFKKVVYRVVPQDTTAAQLLRSGQVDFVEQISPAIWKSLRGQQGIRTMSVPSFQNLLGQLNAKALSLPVRQAISYAINYPGIIAALQGAAVQPSGLVPAGLPGHFTDLPNYHYDPAKAAQLLNQAGYGPGKKPLNLSLTYTQGDSNEQVVVTLLKSSLAKLNINLAAQSLAWPTQWAKAKSGNAASHQSIFLEYWWPDYADPYTWFNNLLLTEKTPYFNLSYYSNPALDKQINDVESLLANNLSSGEQLYRTMQEEVLQQAPLDVLYNVNYQYAMRTSLYRLPA